jgi:ribosomal protein S18 acetylase RimI-like enzyme
VIQLIEELSMNAWPALQVVLYDGWVLRFADGYTRRANSVNPLYLSRQDVGEKIQHCERIYRSRGLSVTYKMTSESLPQGLDDVLAEKGYRVDAPTSVQTLDLGSIEAPTCHARLETALTKTWLSDQCRLSNIDDRKRQVADRMLKNIVPATCYASIDEGDGVVACGLGVLEGEFLGIFDIITHAQHRGRGYGKQIMLNLLSWGKRGGARTAHLGVMLNNPPALHLYESLGFREAYQYWYRVLVRD